MEQFTEKELGKIVLALNGDIKFYGSTEYDEESAKNIRKLGNLIDFLIDQITCVDVVVSGRQEDSAKQISAEIAKIYKNLESWSEISPNRGGNKHE